MSCCSAIAAAVVLTLLAWSEPRADSTLRLTPPTSFGAVPASTFGEDGERLGSARFIVEQLQDGNVRIIHESGIDGGARTVATALLEPVDDGRSLRPLLQESRSFDPQGALMGVLSIDHRRAEARCAGPEGDARAILPLPDEDRVANVPLDLLFVPLVTGEREQISFQLLLCRDDPRFVDFNAYVAGRGQTDETVEIRYGPKIRAIPNVIVNALLPKLSIWFDARRPVSWLAARLPLYARGPEVVVIRTGIPTARLSPQR